MPEPDGAVVRGSEELYAEKIASAADVSCVIEVSDHSIGRDQGGKLLLYAAAGIESYIIINLRERVIEVYTGPSSRRSDPPSFANKQELRVGDVLSIPLPADQRVTIPVAELLP